MPNNVEFYEEENFGVVRRSRQLRPLFVKWVMSTGIAKNEDQANVILVILAIFIFVLSVFVFISIFSGNGNIPAEGQSLASF
ncbi:MAG: hypothetical protein U1D31_01595 [Patescibacteria group bacterium]|nr:hypothetical protein [bacterium]MDZ4240801.1 hypothetical protein [Patescibacteria group bacterium]